MKNTVGCVLDACKRHRLLLFGLGAVVLLALLGGYLMEPLRSRAADRLYKNRQRTAMRPDFQADLDQVPNAPRYTIDASVNPETGEVAGQMTVRYTNDTGGALSHLVFRLYPNAPTIYGGGSLTVSGVEQGGTPLETSTSRGGTVLRVPLNAALEPGASTDVHLTFTAQVPYRSYRGYGIFNRTSRLVSLAGWYPILAPHYGGWQTPQVPRVGDAMYAAVGLYEVRLTVPPGYQVISTGRERERQEGDAGVTWHLVSGPAWEFAAVVGDEYETHTAQVGDVTLRLHTLPAQNPRNSPEEALAVAEGAFRAYVDRFGPYACTELDIVDVPVNIGGYEFPGMVYVETGKRTRGSESAYDYLLAHEMAHQWWYNIVGSQTVAEPWLDESFATYGHYLYLEHSGQAEAAEDRLAYWQRTYGPRRPHQPPVNSPATDFAGWSGYRRTVYVQGALFLHTLREEMGDEAFFRLLQRLQQQYRYRRPTTIRFLTTAEEVAGRDLNPLFEEWFAIQAEGAR